MKDRSLIAFTILSQTAVGALWVVGLLQVWAADGAGKAAAQVLMDKALPVIGPLMIMAILASFFHLGRPINGWRALGNLRCSWLSREVLFAMLFAGGLGLVAGLQRLNPGGFAGRNVIAWGVALLGLVLIWSMASAYRLRTIPAWNTWVTPASFFTTAFLLGALAVGATLAAHPGFPPEQFRPLVLPIALAAMVLLCAQFVIISRWIAGLAIGRGAAQRSAARITQAHRIIFSLRLALAALGVALVGIILSPWGQGAMTSPCTILAFFLVLASEVLGRILFYEARVNVGV